MRSVKASRRLAPCLLLGVAAAWGSGGSDGNKVGA